MKKTIRIMLALAVAVTLVGGAFAGSAAAQQAISDDDGIDAQVNADNPTTAVAANGVNVGGSQNAAAIAASNQDVGDDYSQDDSDVLDIL